MVNKCVGNILYVVSENTYAKQCQKQIQNSLNINMLFIIFNTCFANKCFVYVLQTQIRSDIDPGPEEAPMQCIRTEGNYNQNIGKMFLTKILTVIIIIIVATLFNL